MRCRCADVSGPCEYARSVAEYIWRSLSEIELVTPGGECRYFSIWVASVLPPGAS